MKKTLYSLMLDDSVVREVDRLAHRVGVSRSALVNQILAEYVDLPTPERRVGDVFRAIESILRPDSELVPFFAPNAMSMSLKSSLDYKYRPTVKYSVELYRAGGDSIGELSVAFRTQSAALLESIHSFFRIWKRTEDQVLAPMLGGELPCALYDSKFVRALAAPDRNCSAEELAATISSYVRLFDRCMKGYLAGQLSPAEIGRQFEAYVKQAEFLI